MSKATVAALGQLHALLAEALGKVIREGVKVVDKEGEEHVVDAPAAFFKEAREFLKDNHIEADPEKNPGLKSLADSLPFPSKGDDAEMTAH